RVETQHWLFGDSWINSPWCALCIPLALHVIQQLADILSGESEFKSPRCICVPECRCKIRHIAEHHSLVGHRLREIDSGSVDDELETAHEFHVEPSGSYDDIGIDRVTGLQLQSAGCKPVYLISYDRRST